MSRNIKLNCAILSTGSPRQQRRVAVSSSRGRRGHRRRRDHLRERNHPRVLQAVLVSIHQHQQGHLHWIPNGEKYLTVFNNDKIVKIIVVTKDRFYILKIIKEKQIDGQIDRNITNKQINRHRFGSRCKLELA
jgi:hypothetical protein